MFCINHICHCSELALVHLSVRNLAFSEVNRLLSLDVILLELCKDLLRIHLSLGLRNFLNDVRKFLVHSLWKLEAVEGIHAALAGLAVDADHRLVFPADIAWVDRQIGNLPDAVRSL